MNFETWLKKEKNMTISDLTNEQATDSGDVAIFASPLAGDVDVKKMAPEPIVVDTDLKPKKKKKKRK